MRIIIKQKYISSKKILNESRYSRQLLCRAHVGRQHAGPFTGSKQLRPRLCSCWVMGPIIGLLFFFFLQLPRATAVQGGRLEDDCRSSVSHSKLLSYLSGLFCWGGKNAEEKKKTLLLHPPLHLCSSISAIRECSEVLVQLVEGEAKGRWEGYSWWSWRAGLTGASSVKLIWPSPTTSSLG